ncbi:hypothetical protein OTU49_002291, partial [Cherax quadricarinatus]
MFTFMNLCDSCPVTNSSNSSPVNGIDISCLVQACKCIELHQTVTQEDGVAPEAGAGECTKVPGILRKKVRTSKNMVTAGRDRIMMSCTDVTGKVQEKFRNIKWNMKILYPITHAKPSKSLL